MKGKVIDSIRRKVNHSVHIL